MLMKSGLIIISNNPLVIANYQSVQKIDGGIIEVLQCARNYIHQGHKLLTHPLAGSVKPNETPYKTVIVGDDSEILDFESVKIIEGSFEVAKKLLKDRPVPQWNERILDDFQVIDRSLLDAALASLSVY